MTNSTFIIILVVLALWLSVLTFFVMRMIAHYNRLTGASTGTNLKELLDELLARHNRSLVKMSSIEDAIIKLARDGDHHVQRIGIVRFNPFLDTGGNQSFTIALLDRQDTGIVMTSLYARAGNRWYVKDVENGKGAGLELSKEEVAAIAQAHDMIEKV